MGRGTRYWLIPVAGLALAAHVRADAPIVPLALDRPLMFTVSDRFTYDDNIFRLPPSDTPDVAFPGPGSSVGDRINTVAAALDGLWTLGLQSITAKAMVADNHFSNNTDLDNVSGNARLEWDWLLASVLSGKVGGDYSRSLADFANTQFYSKDIITDGDYYASVIYDLGPHWRLKGNIRGENALHSASIRDGDDYNSRAGSVGFEYVVSPLEALGLDYRYTNVGFRQGETQSGGTVNRDYDDNAISGYVSYILGKVTTIEAGAGYVNRTYTSGSIVAGDGGNFSGDVWHFYLTWQPDVQVGVKLKVWRDLRAYLDAESNYFVSHGVSLVPTWSPLERIVLSIEAGHENQDYVGSNLVIDSLPQRRDSLNYAAMLVKYKFRRRIELDASYRYERRGSDVDYNSYRDNLAYASLQYSF